MTTDDDLVPVFMPALIALLIHAEDDKAEPLTRDEVESIRDNASCKMAYADVVIRMEESRGYRDIDPENCWHDWQMTRRRMGRKPELDPGPRFDQVRSSDPAYRQTIEDALSTIEQFRQMLPTDGTPRADALVKTKLTDDTNSAFMWLNNTSMDGESFSAELFEVPDTLPNYNVGDRLTVPLDSLLDWMVNDHGLLHGGFSLRYHRDRMNDAEKAEYDQHIGVTDYK
jgi:uncharacterized protein YegJ (DUF2314 family)